MEEKKKSPWTAICKLLQLEHMLTPHVEKKRSKWVEDLHIGYNTINLLKFWERWSAGI